MLKPSEEHGNQRHRVMDMVWSKKTYRLREIVEDHGNRVMYYLKDGPERAFVKEELMLIPEDTELPPNLRSKVVIFIHCIDIMMHSKMINDSKHIDISYHSYDPSDEEIEILLETLKPGKVTTIN